MEPSEQRTIYQHYEVERRADGSLHELGRGAMGITYKAIDANLHVPVALKVITGVLLPDARARSRFLREARAAAQLRHSNVATVYHLGQEADFCFYTMEFIEGETLEARIRRDGPMHAPDALGVCFQVARALQAAHTRGLLHRDLKPSNLMLASEGGELIVKVIDFGLVKPLQQDSADASVSLSGGLFLGTPLYASPEQCASEDTIDGRSDLYSLGATLWFMLTGEAPFKGSMRTVITQHLTKPPAFETVSGQHPAVVALLRDLLAKDPAERPADAAALRVRLLEVLPILEPGSGSRMAAVAASASSATTAEVPPPLADEFTLDEVLRRRGSLPPGEVTFLLPRLAALADAATPAGTGSGAVLDLSPRNVRLRLMGSDGGAAAQSLPALPLREWPLFSVEAIPPPPSTAAATATATGSIDGTLLQAPENAPSSPVESLALLVYELLNGSPLPFARAYRPLSVLGEGGNNVLRNALPLGQAAVYANGRDFCAALTRAIEESGTHAAPIRTVLTDIPPIGSKDRPAASAQATSVVADLTALADPPRQSLPSAGQGIPVTPVTALEIPPKRLPLVPILAGSAAAVLLLAIVLGITWKHGANRQTDGTVSLASPSPSPTPTPPSPSGSRPPAPPLPLISPAPHGSALEAALQKEVADGMNQLQPSPAAPAALPVSPAVTPPAPAAATPATARRRPLQTPPPPAEPSRLPRKSTVAAADTPPAKTGPKKGGVHEMQRQAIEKQHRNGQLSDSDYRTALKMLGD